MEILDPSLIASIEDVPQQASPSPVFLDPSQIASIEDVPGVGTSFGLGAAQGATFGGADEIAAAVKSAFSDETYKEARDRYRQTFKEAQETNPVAYGVGEVGGGIATVAVPGLGAARAATTAGKIGRAVVEGGIAGLGYSEAKNGKDLAKDILTGAAFGGAVGTAGTAVVGGVQRGLRKLAQTAPDRVKQRIVKEIVKSTNPKPRNNLIGKGGQKADEVGEFILNDDGLLATHRDPVKFLDTIKQKASQVGDELDEVYPVVDANGAGIKIEKVKKVFDGALAEAKRDFRPNIARAIQRKIDDTFAQLVPEVATDAKGVGNAIKVVLGNVEKSEKRLASKAIKFQLEKLKDAADSFGDKSIDRAKLESMTASMLSRAKGLPEGALEKVREAMSDVVRRSTTADKGIVRATEMRTLVRSLQDDALAGADITNLNQMRETFADIAGSVRDILNDYVEDVGGQLGNASLEGIRALNKRMSMLLRLKDVAEQSAKRAQGATEVAPFSLQNLRRIASNPTIAGAAAVIDPSGVGAANVALQLGTRAAARGDEALARAVKSGADPAALVGRATQTLGSGARRATLPAVGAATRPDPAITRLQLMAEGGAPADEVFSTAAQLGVSPAVARRIMASR